MEYEIVVAKAAIEFFGQHKRLCRLHTLREAERWYKAIYSREL